MATGRKKKWLLGLLAFFIAGGAGLFFLARRYAGKIEPYIRDQAVGYLRDRFDAEVQMGSLQIDIPAFSPVKLYVSKGKGVLASVTGRDILLRKDSNLLLRMNSMRFEVDIGKMMEPERGLTTVLLDGFELVIPPKGERRPGQETEKNEPGGPASAVRIGEVILTNAKLTISPKDPSRVPLEFELHRVRLTDAGVDAPMRYEAQLRNAKPPGEIKAKGNFGPWVKDDPGATPLDGSYEFDRANLGVFNAIGGILHSTGTFQGRLNNFTAKGEATVPDFHLKTSGNKMPLKTEFEVEVDGTNGNTVLKPVHGVLGKTAFKTSGGVIKHDGDQRRTISLDVDMPAGRLEDVLLLAMKGKNPFMSGTLRMKSSVLLPPLSGKVIEKLRLNGHFDIKNAMFLRSQIQDRIDKMSRQAQGQPKNEEIDEVVSRMRGRFAMANESITLRDLDFGIPGADLKLNGTYNLHTEALDFRGTLRLQAKLSQTQTGWKRWALKPVDPFFTKDGKGTFVKIKIEGTRQDPKFGKD